MATTVGSHSAIDGILILEAIRTLLSTDPSEDSYGDENGDTREYIDNIITAIKVDVGVTEAELDTAWAWSAREWTGALVRGLYGMDRIKELRAKNVI